MMIRLISAILVCLFVNSCGSGLAQQCNQNPDGSCMGAWTSVPYSATDYYGGGSMNWLVPQSGVLTFKYAIAGNTMIVSFHITGSNISGNLANTLKIKIPAGKTATSNMLNAIAIDNGGVHIMGFAYVVAGGNEIVIARIDEALFNTDHWTYVYGQLVFQIN